MATKKQVVMFSSRAFTLRRSGETPLHIAAGRNVIDADVADHPYVKAHATGPMSSDAADAEALLAAQERIAELESILLAGQAHIVELEAALEAKDADMQALVDSMNAPAPKAKK